MKITEIKSELEKVSKIIPELRHDLDEIYASDEGGKKRKMKELWRQYENKYNEVKNSKIYKTLQ
ncbi:MAG: hypothetical protein AB7I27_11295 [Bacteriovoracaceae bacterium]